jgi:hypothetical protein
MAWTRYDSVYPSNPKVVALSDAAYRLWTSAIAYANLHLTDGRLPASQLRAQLPNSRYPNRAAEELVAARLFHPLPLPIPLPCSSPHCPCSLAIVSTSSPDQFPESSIASPVQLRASWESSRADGWVVHDFWDLQPKSWEERQKTKKRVEAGRQGGLAKAKQRAGEPQKPDPIPLDPIRSDPSGEERSRQPAVQRHEQVAQLVTDRLHLKWPGTSYQLRIQACLPLPTGVVENAIESTKNADRPNWEYLVQCLESPRGRGPQRVSARDRAKSEERELEAEVMRRWEALPDDDHTHPDEIREQIRRERREQAS